MGLSAACIYGYPARDMSFIGFTGTNGKTTGTYLTEHLLRRKGIPVGVVGTIEDRWPGHTQRASFTTPRADDYQKILADMREAGVWCVVSEVSSHALKQYRMIGIEADVAVFSNLTLEHRELHPTMEDYYETKRRLFTQILKPAGNACINVDDPAGRHLAEELTAMRRQVIRYGLFSPDCEVTARDVRASSEGTRFTLVTPDGSVEVDSPLLGRFNVYNQLAAVSAVLHYRFPLDFIAAGLKTFSGTPGRLERIDEGQEFLALVDFAHSPDALLNVLETVRPIVQGKLITLMGCGGCRSREKRAPMGQIAVLNSDFVVVTADNSRLEKTEDIIEDIKKGMVGHEAQYMVEPDRSLAILEAVRRAGPSDCVLLCGKGHEDTQIEQGRTRHFDDRSECRKAIRTVLGRSTDGE
jgi:UDP-N-acetylmuramoyl-L-alanyl-D-glutamate--2,6-diaminopimelate ligase